MFESFILVLMAAAVGTGFLYLLYRRAQETRGRARLRATFLDDVQTLFTGGLKAANPDGFPRISGTYEDLTFDIQAVPDTLNMRKLPTLWLLVSLPEPMPVKATFDLMMRPRGVELFSNHSALPVQMQTDEAFPHDCSIRTDAPLQLPARELLLRHTHIFANGKAKELLISPKGLRVVWLAEEADRSRYLLFRDSEMGLTPFPARDAKPLLDYLITLRKDLLASCTENAS